MSKNADNKIKYLTQQKTKSLFDAVNSIDNVHAVRNLTIFRIAYRYGLRASEIVLIRLEDYNAVKG